MEAVTNAVRHGAPRAVAVRLGQEARGGEPGLTLVVEDDGAGFDPDHTRVGVGLASMTERAQELGGTLAVEPAGGGTTLRAWLPTASPHDPSRVVPGGAAP
jgi:signal transduction histidine kinase